MTHKRSGYAFFLILLTITLMSCAPGAQPAPTQAPVVENPTVTPTPVVESPTPAPTPQTVPLTDDVTVILPWQEQETFVEVLSKDPTGSPGSSLDDKVMFIRALVDFKVVDKSGNTVREFDPAMTIVAQYTGQDIEKAGGVQNLVLGSYDAQSKVWVAISAGNTVPGDNQTVKVETVEWGDKWACMCAKSIETPPPQ